MFPKKQTMKFAFLLFAIFLTFTFVYAQTTPIKIGTTTPNRPVKAPDAKTIKIASATGNADTVQMNMKAEAKIKWLEETVYKLQTKTTELENKLTALQNIAGPEKAMLTINVTAEGKSNCPACREKVRIDHAFTNNNPNAKIFFTYAPLYPFHNPHMVQLSYNKAEGYWYFVREVKVINDLNSYSPYLTFIQGDVFHLTIMK